MTKDSCSTILSLWDHLGRFLKLKISIHQPNYLPWIGYFDKLDQSDCSIFLDRAQLAKKSVTNRNYILTPTGKLLLTVPVKREDLSIHKVLIDNSFKWKLKHWGAIEANYKKTPFWTLYQERFRQIYESEWGSLCDLNIRLIELICEILEINVKFYRESAFEEDFGYGSQRIANLVVKFKGDIYISGRGAEAYNNPDDFESKGIQLLYQKFEHPTYRQNWGKDFTKSLSTIDLIFNHGPESINIIHSTRNSLVNGS